MTTFAYRTCPLCEATCGLEIEMPDRVSRAGGVQANVVWEGAMSLPYGWGDDRRGTRLTATVAPAGVSGDVLTGPGPLDPLSATAVLCGTR